jgi:hypothetical protein
LCQVGKRFAQGQSKPNAARAGDLSVQTAKKAELGPQIGELLHRFRNTLRLQVQGWIFAWVSVCEAAGCACLDLIHRDLLINKQGTQMHSGIASDQNVG